MGLVTYNDSFSVNVSEIDQQHQKLFSIINKLDDAMRERRAKDILGEIINDLINYTTAHFTLEEKYFDQFDYYDTAPHKKEHNDFVKKVMDFKKAFDENRLMLSIDIISFLQDWLASHIKGNDKKYGPFFNEKGLK